uniref:Uncharacterized protein n=1 Tax=Aegilops tauschii subsp. strangulata TaxID=200361 RepID=A0A453BBY9_AEGTS
MIMCTLVTIILQLATLPLAVYNFAADNLYSLSFFLAFLSVIIQVLKIGRTVNPYIHLYVPFLHTPIATVRRWWLRLRDTEDEIRIGLTRSVVQRRKTYIYYVSVCVSRLSR